MESKTLKTVANFRQRARSAEQKAARRQRVLDDAESYFLEVGYEAFSLTQLAKRADVVKGTLYLYFQTKEELFLTLYEQSLERWSEAFMASLPSQLTSERYAELLYTTAMADGTFVPLLIRLEHVIEHNVAIDRLIASKRLFMGQVEAIAAKTSEALALSSEQATEVVKTMGVLLIGATRSDQGPALDQEDLPHDVSALIESFASEPLFVKNAVRIIEGMRGEPTNTQLNRT